MRTNRWGATESGRSVVAITLLIAVATAAVATAAVDRTANRVDAVLVTSTDHQGTEAARPGTSAEPAGPSELTRAEQDVALAWQAVNRARADQARVLASPALIELAAAERAYQSAQMTALRTRLDLDRISSNPTLTETYDRAVQRAEATLKAVQLDRTSVTGVGMRASTIADAMRALDEARTRRDEYLAGAAVPQEVEVAHRAHAAAQTALEAAADRLMLAREGASHLSLDATNTAVSLAQEALHQAQLRLGALTSDQRCCPTGDHAR